MKPIISPNVRIRVPEHFEVADDSVVDDFCYFSTRVRVGRCCHIANGCSVAGGRDRQFTLGDFSSLSAGVKVWCSSDDFTHDIVVILPQGCEGIKSRYITGDVTFDRLTAVGSNSVVMPDNHIPEGTVIGALSFVPARFRFKPWSVYAGMPIRLLWARDRAGVLAQCELLERRLAGRLKRGRRR